MDPKDPRNSPFISYDEPNSGVGQDALIGKPPTETGPITPEEMETQRQLRYYHNLRAIQANHNRAVDPQGNYVIDQPLVGAHGQEHDTHLGDYLGMRERIKEALNPPKDELPAPPPDDQRRLRHDLPYGALAKHPSKMDPQSYPPGEPADWGDAGRRAGDMWQFMKKNNALDPQQSPYSIWPPFGTVE